MMSKFEVCLRSVIGSDRWSLMFQAEDFAHAEEQAIDYLHSGEGVEWPKHWEIIRIDKDYGRQ